MSAAQPVLLIGFTHSHYVPCRPGTITVANRPLRSNSDFFRFSSPKNCSQLTEQQVQWSGSIRACAEGLAFAPAPQRRPERRRVQAKPDFSTARPCDI